VVLSSNRFEYSRHLLAKGGYDVRRSVRYSMALALVTLTAACSSPTLAARHHEGPGCCSAPPAIALLTGSLQGGGFGLRPLSGTVTAQTRAGGSATAIVGANGRFSMRLPIGTYTVMGRSPLYQEGAAECLAAHPIVVTKKATIAVNIT
jgi:hypothetical protein